MHSHIDIRKMRLDRKYGVPGPEGFFLLSYNVCELTQQNFFRRHYTPTSVERLQSVFVARPPSRLPATFITAAEEFLQDLRSAPRTASAFARGGRPLALLCYGLTPVELAASDRDQTTLKEKRGLNPT
jgi:hypothetical protein